MIVVIILTIISSRSLFLPITNFVTINFFFLFIQRKAEFISTQIGRKSDFNCLVQSTCTVKLVMLGPGLLLGKSVDISHVSAYNKFHCRVRSPLMTSFTLFIWSHVAFHFDQRKHCLKIIMNKQEHISFTLVVRKNGCWATNNLMFF